MSFPGKKRVLHFITKGEIGGQEKAIYYLLKGFEGNKDFEVGVAFARKIGTFAKEIEQLNVPLIELNLKSGLDFKFNRKLLGELKQFQIHHLHDPSPNIALLSILCGSQIKRAFTRRGGFHNYSRKGIKTWLKYKINKFLIKNYFNGFSGNTTLAAEFVRNFYQICDKPVYVLYNGIFFDDLEPTIPKNQILNELNISNKDFKIGTACHLLPIKRINLVIRAFALCKIGEKKLVIFGKGPEEKNLKKLAKESNLEQSIIFAGEVFESHNYIRALDCFILASGIEESFGNALVEAMYLKIPSIIMSDSKALKEHVIDNQTGFVAEDKVGLAKKIEFIFGNRAEAQKIAENGSAYVSKKYTVQNMLSRYIEFYKDILK
jgi:glycosyltransferase involved in cell wall biosynthesis